MKNGKGQNNSKTPPLQPENVMSQRLGSHGHRGGTPGGVTSSECSRFVSFQVFYVCSVSGFSIQQHLLEHRQPLDLNPPLLQTASVPNNPVGFLESCRNKTKHTEPSTLNTVLAVQQRDYQRSHIESIFGSGSAPKTAMWVRGTLA